jgi:hypothetical protein
MQHFLGRMHTDTDQTLQIEIILALAVAKKNST